MLLTTRATKEIAARYGGLENLGDKLMQSEAAAAPGNFEMALDEIVWLITLLVNQSVLVHNLKNPQNKQPEVTAEMVDLLTSPYDLAEYKNAILDAMHKGIKRNVVSERDLKNTTAEQGAASA